VNLEHIFAQYGYVALLFGSLADGTPFMVFGGFAAHRGWLVLLPWVILAGAAGNFLASLGWFLAARTLGERILELRPGWAREVGRVRPYLQRYESLAIIGIRFVPGMSLGGLFAAALAGVSLPRFIVLNTIAALLWAALYGVLGYLLGHAVEQALGEIGRIEKPLALVLLAAGLIWIAAVQVRRWRAARTA
jgi:membrane protein DedA with SNARE-associated domain